MADDLIRRRRAADQKIIEGMKKNGIPVNDRSLARIRMDITGSKMNIVPKTVMFERELKTNDLPRDTEIRRFNEIQHVRAELKQSIETSGEQQISRKQGVGKYPIIMQVEDDPPPQEDYSNLSPEEYAKLSYDKRRERQKQNLENNKIFNRKIADHIYNTTSFTDLNAETHKDMQNCNDGVQINSSHEHLQRGHDRMYQTVDYQTIVKRRKDIKLCKSATGSLSESAQRTMNDLLEYDRLGNPVDEPLG